MDRKEHHVKSYWLEGDLSFGQHCPPLNNWAPDFFIHNRANYIATWPLRDVSRKDNAIHWKSLYPMDRKEHHVKSYWLEGDLSFGQHCPPLNNWAQDQLESDLSFEQCLTGHFNNCAPDLFIHNRANYIATWPLRDVSRKDNAIHWKSLYPMDRKEHHVKSYWLEGDLSFGQHCPPLNNWAQDLLIITVKGQTLSLSYSNLKITKLSILIR